MNLITVLTLAKEGMESRLDSHATIEESLRILDHKPDLRTKKSWVCSQEGVEDIEESTPREIFDTIDDLDISNKYEDNYDEFTYSFCPCPNYLEVVEMIKEIER